jgi:hypothetical protein
MPLGAARLTLLAFQPTVAVEAEVVRKKVGVSAEGNAQVDTAQSKFGGASGLFDGTGDYLSINVASSYNDDFTIETWVRLDALPSSGTFRMIFAGDSNTEYASIANQSGTYVSNLVIRNSGGSLYETYYTIPSISTNTWYHWAVVKSGSTIKHFFDGTELTTLYSSTGTMGSDYGFDGYHYLARWNGNTSHMLDGYMDELRISNTARYTSGFTPSTTPFVNDDNTKLLLHMNGTDASTFFEDDNGVGRTPIDFTTVNAQSEIDTAEKKFGSSSLKASGNGALVRYTGSNAGPFYQRAGAMTVECFVKINSDTGSNTVPLVTLGSSNATVERACSLMWRNYDRKFQAVYYPKGASSSQKIVWGGTGMSAVTLPSAWIHLAMAWTTSEFSVWVDGTRYNNTTLTTTDGDIGTDGNLDIGNNLNVSDNGWIDEVRISSVDRYGVGNSTITVPTTAFVNDSDTLALHHFNGNDGDQSGAGFRDDNGTGRSAVGVTAIADAQVDTAQYKFGGASALFDGTGDYLQTSQPVVPSSVGFTTECWIRIATTGTRKEIFNQYAVAPDGRFLMWVDTDNKLKAFIGGTNGTTLATTSTLSTGTWYHVAFVTTTGGNAYLFLDGTQEASDTGVTQGAYQGDNLSIGEEFGSGTGFFNGHIDEVRISDTARYTAGFTPDTTPFQNDANTLLLLHMDGTDGSTVFIDDNGKQST